MNKFFLVLILLSFFEIGCQKKNHESGGQDIGGGNVVMSGEISVAEVQTFVATLERKRFELFRSLEVTSLVAHRVVSLPGSVVNQIPTDELEKFRFQANLKKLIFANQEKYLKTVSSALVEIKATGPCYSAKGQPVDGSIFGQTKPICLSAERILQKLKRDDYQLQLLSLYMHEASHLFGASEEEASQLQNQILGVGPNFKNYFAFLFEPSNKLVSTIQKMQRTISLAKNVTQGEVNPKKEKICPGLQSLFDDSYKMFLRDNAQKVMISYLRLEDIVRTHAVFVASAFAKDYCEWDGSGGKVSRLAKWHGKAEVSLKEIYPDPLTLVSFFETKERTLILSQYLLADLSPVRIRQVREGDGAALLFNLSVIEQTLNEIVLPETDAVTLDSDSGI